MTQSFLTINNLVASYYTLSGSPIRTPSRFDWADRMKAAADAGYAGIGLSIVDYNALEANGLNGHQLRSVADDFGVSIVEVEMLYDWHLDDEPGAQSRDTENRLFEMAETLGATTLMAGVSQPPGEIPPLDVLANKLGQLCDRAANVGLNVALEFMTGSAIDSPQLAHELIARADRSNGGIMVDCWHLYRSGYQATDLHVIPSNKVFGVQIGDAAAKMIGSPFEDTTLRRLPPGKGELEIVSFLAKLAQLKVQSPITVEIISSDWKAKDLRSAATESAQAASQVIAAARTNAQLIR